MADTAVADPDSGLSPAELAARHGLKVAGRRPGLLAYTRQLWAYRYFITAYANARLVATYSRAKLGQLWQVLTPLSNAAVYFVIFGIVLGADRGIDNFIGYLCTGLFVFVFTQTVVSSGVQAITGNLGLIRALHFPRGCLPVAFTLTQFQNLLASMIVLVGIVLVTGEPITVGWLLVIPALLLQALFNAGLAMAMARVGAKVSDLKQVVPFAMRTWMYGSGVLYSVHLFEQHLPGWATQVAHLNPLLIYIELIRDALMADPPLTAPTGELLLKGAVWAIVMSIAGFIYFWRGEQEYGRG